MEGETILCVATRRWNSLWRSTQQIMSRIAELNRVLFFEPGRDPDSPHLAEMWRNLPNFKALRAQKLHQNLIVVPTPPRLPVARQYLHRSVLQVTTPWVATINARILIRHICWAMRVYDVEAPILWLYSPYHVDLVGKFGEKLACYYVYDEYPDFLHNSRIKQLLRELDNRLSSQVDVVFACSRPLWKRRKAVNVNTYLILNAVDFELFNRALTADLPLPADIATVPRPVIGFAGWLGYHIDVDLLQRVAEAYQDCSLVLVGPDELPDAAGRRRLRALPNVFFLGQKERHELPDYLQAFDVALLPYLLIDQTRWAYPLKLHEYLAAGRAVVSVRLPELQCHNGVLRIAETHDEFVKKIGEALHDYAPEAIEARVAVARENTWNQRVDAIYRVLQQHLPG